MPPETFTPRYVGAVSKRPYHHGNVREAAKMAALALLDAEGPGAISLRRVARDADLSHTAVGREFGGLPELLIACTAAIYHDLGAAQREAMRAVGDDSFAALTALGNAYLAYGREYPQRIQWLGHPLVVAAEGHAELLAAREVTHAQLLACARACVADGTVRDGDPEAIAVFVWSAVHGFTTLFSASRVSPVTEEALMMAVYLGLRP